MNPATASVPAAPRRLVDNVARPAPAPAPAAASDSMPIAAPQVVANIPVHAPTAPAAPASEDDELDRIMRDVGQELKKESVKPAKKGLFSFFHKAKAKPQPSATAVHKAPVAAQSAPAPQPTPVSAPVRAVARPQPQPTATPAAKVKKQTSVPAFAIFVALLVTGFLTVAAIAAYRQ